MGFKSEEFTLHFLSAYQYYVNNHVLAYSKRRGMNETVDYKMIEYNILHAIYL